MTVATAVDLRRLHADDLAEVLRIDSQHANRCDAEYWDRVFQMFFGGETDVVRVGLAATAKGVMIGYLLGSVQAFELGSEACGWIFAVGVDRGHLRRGVASSLVAAACRCFAQAGATRVRTMVRRREVPVMAFFRSNGFVGGEFIQLELELGEPT